MEPQKNTTTSEASPNSDMGVTVEKHVDTTSKNDVTRAKLPSTLAIAGRALGILKKRALIALGIIGLTVLLSLVSLIIIGVSFFLLRFGITALIVPTILTAASVVACTFLSAGLYYAFIFHEEQIGIFTSLKKGTRFTLPLLWVSVLLCGILMTSVFTAFLATIPLLAITAFAIPLVFTDERRGIGAFRESFALVRGYFFPVLGRMVLIFLASLIIYIAFAKGPHIDFVLGSYRPIEIVASTVGFLVKLFLNLFGVAFCVSLFESLRAAKKDGVRIVPPRWPFVTLAIVGPLLMIALIAGSILFARRDDKLVQLRDHERIIDLRSLQIGIELYGNMHARYPATLQDLVTEKIVPSVPTDPLLEKPYVYAPSPKGDEYDVCAVLEAPKDTNVDTGVGGSYCIHGALGQNLDATNTPDLIAPVNGGVSRSR